MQIREDLKEQVVLVNVVGVVALLNPHEVILGLEVKMDAVNGWRKKYGLRQSSIPTFRVATFVKKFLMTFSKLSCSMRQEKGIGT